MPELFGSAPGLPKIATPANPPSGYVSLYAKSDDKVYALSSGGVETDLTATGGGGGGASRKIFNYMPATNTTITVPTTAGTMDATNLAFTITATATTMLVTVSGVWTHNDTSGMYLFLNNTSNVKVTDYCQIKASPAITEARLTASILATGLTIGNNYTYRLGGLALSVTGTVKAGPTYGPVTITAEAV